MSTKRILTVAAITVVVIIATDYLSKNVPALGFLRTGFGG